MKSSKVIWEEIFFFSAESVSADFRERKGKKFSEEKWKNTHPEPLSWAKRWGLGFFGFSYKKKKGTPGKI